MAVSVIYGLAYSYGQFFKPMTEAFDVGEGAGSVVFAITSLLGFGLSVLTGPLTDRIGPRVLLVIAAVSLGAGLVSTAMATSIWQAYLSYGLGVGISLGCVYVPILAAIGRWFDRLRALAMGIVVTGVGLGTFAGPPLSAWLIAQAGWRTAYLCYAAGGSALLVFAALLIAPPPQPPQSGSVGQAGQRRGFGIFYAATMLINVVIYVPYVHLSYSAQLIGVNALTAASLVSVIGISNILGRIAVASLARNIGPLLLFKACHVGLGLSFVAWLTAYDYGGLLVFAVLLGACHGTYSALIPVVAAQEFGTQNLGKVLGILFTALGLGSAVGPPLTGYLVQSTGGYSTSLVTLTVIGLAGAGVLLTYRSRYRPS